MPLELFNQMEVIIVLPFGFLTSYLIPELKHFFFEFNFICFMAIISLIITAFTLLLICSFYCKHECCPLRNIFLQHIVLFHRKCLMKLLIRLCWVLCGKIKTVENMNEQTFFSATFNDEHEWGENGHKAKEKKMYIW